MLMMNQPSSLRVWEKLLAICVLLISLATSLIAAGYQWRGVAETRARVDILELGGSSQARITATDVDWLKKQNDQILKEIGKLQDLLLQHMQRDGQPR
jgi:hypothetical protein